MRHSFRIALRTFGAALATVSPLSLTPLPAPAQSTNPAYLSEMPSVDRVLQQEHGSDVLDTQLRQLGALHQLSRMIPIMASGLEHRPPQRLTPDELRIKTAYDSAFDPLLAKATTAAYLQRGYGSSAVFLETILNQFFSPQFRELYHKANPAEQVQLKYETTPQPVEPVRPAPQPQINIFNAPQSGSSMATGNTGSQGDMASGMQSLARNVNKLIYGGPVHPGLQMIGAFKGEGIAIDFGPRQIVTVDCGGLAPLPRSYTVERNAGRVVVTINNRPQPQPILLQFRPDGSLTGQGLITVAGKVQVGSTRHWVADYNANAPGYWAVTPVYEDRITRCNVGLLKATGAIQTTGGDVNNMLSMFGMQGTRFKATPGLRLNGQYTSPTGAGIEFDEDIATLHCGSNVTQHGYAVSQTDRDILVGLDNGITLTMATSGGLTAESSPPSCTLRVLSPPGR
ncbi:MAG: hypothetical protein KGN79_04225 [Acidobacteriota bacterium]|nr:hypothetical protein [Acidobacteriota bacterium]